jgi:rhomboid protease GluP
MQPEYSDYRNEQAPPQPDPFGEQVPAGPPRPQRVPVRMPATKPIATYILLGLIVLIYLAGMVISLDPTVVDGYRVTSAEEWLFVRGAKINELIIGRGEVYRLLTAMFLHGSLTHLFFNGYALYIIGRNIETVYGHARFLLIYFLGGLTGSLLSLLFSTYPSVGASGAIFALFGAEIVFVYRHRKLFGSGAYRQLQNMIVMLGLNIVIGLTPGSRIDNWGHLGGFVGGLALAALIGPWLKVAVAPGMAVTSAGTPPMLEMVDENPLRRRLYVPILYAALFVLVLGTFLQMQG